MLERKALAGLYRTKKLFPSFSPEETEVVQSELLSWYDLNRRKLPWRGDKLEGHPFVPPSGYGTWISEVMLQQTRVETVILYWFRWMDRFPTIEALAASSTEEVNVMWAGLGYYRRAAQILACAKVLVSEHGGRLPETSEELKKLPGIGPYTAGAISSIAFGRITGVVDGNVNRVLSRVRAIDTVLGPALDKVCWQLINPLVHPERPGHFNQAVMELGATLCKPTSPRCTDCPLQSVCHAYHLTQYNSSHSSKIDDIEDLHVSLPREVTEFPKKAAKKPPKELLFGICVLKMLSRDTDKCDMAGDLTKIKYLFVKRPPKGLLENQWEFPSVLVNPDTMATDHETMSVGQKLKFWLPICQDHLQSELGIGVHHCEKPHQQNEVHHVFRTDDITVHPQPIVHVFSHQRHTMNILEATFNPGLCIAGSIGLSSESARRSLMDPWHTSNASGSREVMWMTLDELKQKGITTGVQKIINTVTASATKLKVNKVKESRLLKKVSTKKCDDSCQKGYDYNASDSQPRKRKITQFFKPA